MLYQEVIVIYQEAVLPKVPSCTMINNLVLCIAIYQEAVQAILPLNHDQQPGTVFILNAPSGSYCYVR